MIFINRSNKIPKKFNDGSVNREETDKVIEHYKKSNAPYKPYQVYNSPEVKEALIDLFHNKCAYCESIITNHPAEVEHFRPKNQIKNGDGVVERPGYYWLAADWNNLYLSCIDCNRRRYHAVPGEKNKMILGKLDQFPLRDRTKRWKNYLDEKEKKSDEVQRLLINPCIEDPQLYLSFSETGVILPNGKANSVKNLKAIESIRVYALQRKGLVDERKRYYLKYIKIALIDIVRLKKLLDNQPDKASMNLINSMIEEKIELLIKAQAKTQPYSAMTNHILKNVLPQILGKKIMHDVQKVP